MHGAIGVSIERVREIGQAFARHDVDAVVNSFAEDGVFRNARGPEVSGRSYRGRAEIRAFFEGLFANSPNIQWRQILLQKFFWGAERKFLEPLMHFTNGHVRDHIVSSKIDHGPP